MAAPLERAEVSEYEVRIYQLFSGTSGWLTNKEVSQRLSMNGNTVKLHTRRFTSLGLLEKVAVFPEYKYRLSVEAEKKPYFKKLKQASEVF